jgi:hypothetical protein
MIFESQRKYVFYMLWNMHLEWIFVKKENILLYFASFTKGIEKLNLMPALLEVRGFVKKSSQLTWF